MILEQGWNGLGPSVCFLPVQLGGENMRLAMSARGSVAKQTSMNVMSKKEESGRSNSSKYSGRRKRKRVVVAIGKASQFFSVGSVVVK